MARIEASTVRPRLRDYLQRAGIHVTSDDFIPCQNPGHGSPDTNPSAHIVDDEAVHCFKCEMTYDVFEIDQWRSGSAKFPDVIRRVADFVGMSVDDAPAPKKQKAEKKEEPITLVPISNEMSKSLFSERNLAWAVEKWGKITGKWGARNEQGLMEVVDVRFEKEREAGVVEERSGIRTGNGGTGQTVAKTVISFYYDGTRLQSKNTPVVIFGRDDLAANPDWPVCFHEGAKCRAAAKAIAGIVPLSWNRGVESVGKFELEPIRRLLSDVGAIVYYYPDDDEPGFKAARTLSRRMEAEAPGQNVKICLPAVRGPGFDIVDALAVKTPAEMYEWIINGPEITLAELDRMVAEWEERDKKLKAGKKSDGKTDGYSGGGNSQQPHGVKNEYTQSVPPTGGNSGLRGGNPHANTNEFPFRPLGVADDGYAYFLDCAGRIKKFRLDTLSSTKMLDLAPLPWWSTEFPARRALVEWQEATDFVIRVSQQEEFDPENRRGRGAWRERDGRVCYHDGHDTIGQPDARRLYIRKTIYDMGLSSSPATMEERKNLLDAVSSMSFETKADTTRALAWSLLAPFGGALPWRNAMVLTGSSKSGKSTLLQRVIMPLVATPYHLSGGTSEAGVRQKTGLDSLPVIIDEASLEGKKGQEIRQGLFSLMQQSTSDDAPQVAKGTPNGEGALSYLMRNMFLFSAVTPATGNIEQDNRIMTVNLVPGNPGKWESISHNLETTVTDKVCAGIRAFTWQKLPEILEAATTMTRSIVALIHDSRKGYADALLFAAFWRVFFDRIPAQEEFETWLAQVYKVKPLDTGRDEAEEMLDKLLDQVTKISGDPKTEVTLRELMRGIKYGEIEKQMYADDRELGLSGKTDMRKLEPSELDNWRTTGVNHGLMVDKKSGCLLIKANAAYITKIWEIDGRTYSKLLKRSPKFWKAETAARLGASLWLRGVIWDDEVPF